MTRPKDIGTQAETAVVKALHRLGFEGAERRAQRGAKDCGDVLAGPGVVAEVKGGKAAENASDGQIEKWLDETRRELAHARADAALLIVKRKAIGAVNAHRWWAWLLFDDSAVQWIGEAADVLAVTPRFTLEGATHLLRHWGHGTPARK